MKIELDYEKSWDILKGKRLSGNLLANLKDSGGGVTYREIKKLAVFGEVKFHFLGSMYSNEVKADEK